MAEDTSVEHESREGTDTGAPEAGDNSLPDFEADMHELQAELGEDWILRFSVHGQDGWLTAEKQDSSQRVEAATAEQLVSIVEAIEGRNGAAPDA
jgi:hypothetical protein